MIKEKAGRSFRRRQCSVSYHAELSWPENYPESAKRIIRETMSLSLINNIVREKKLITDSEYRKMSVLIHGRMRQRMQEAIQREMVAGHTEK